MLTSFFSFKALQSGFNYSRHLQSSLLKRISQSSVEPIRIWWLFFGSRWCWWNFWCRPWSSLCCWLGRSENICIMCGRCSLSKNYKSKKQWFIFIYVATTVINLFIDQIRLWGKRRYPSFLLFTTTRRVSLQRMSTAATLRWNIII